MYVASWSGGKDSTATIILAHEHNEPLDLIIFAEVMFDKGISGELPEHMEFVHKCKAIFEEWGYPVKTLRSDFTMVDRFHKVISRSKHEWRNGMKWGFPLIGKCYVNRDCKMRPINEFNKEHPNAIHYVGIATDEPKRLARLNDKKISLLAKYDMTEQDAYDLCAKYDLLSPIYSFTKRGGCWFCPNSKDKELRNLRNNHRDLWNRLLALEEEEGLVNPLWKRVQNISIHDKERQFDMEEKQVRWDI